MKRPTCKSKAVYQNRDLGGEGISEEGSNMKLCIVMALFIAGTLGKKQFLFHALKQANTVALLNLLKLLTKAIVKLGLDLQQ